MKKPSSITLALALIFLMPTWVKAACNAVYTLPVDEWHLISLPCDPGNNNSVADIFGDDIEGQLTEDWAIFKFNAQTQSYDSLSNTDILEQGQGYWITTTSASAVLDLPDTSTETPVSYPSQCSSENGCFDIPLQSSPNNEQWNLLGFPFISNQAWNTSEVVTNNSCQSTACSISEASSHDKNILKQQVWTYVVGEGYVAVDNAKELTPWSGFWAKTLENAFAEGNPRLLISSPIDNSGNGHSIPAISGADKQQFLTLINDARSQGRSCGSHGYFPAVPTLSWSDKLYKVAYEHSQDLAVSHTFDHSGSGTESDWSGFALNKQSSVSDRLATYNYDWNSYGENIAAGQTTAEEAMNGWINSPGHCKNIMSNSVTQVGMAKKTNLDAPYRYYWTQNFGRSR